MYLQNMNWPKGRRGGGTCREGEKQHETDTHLMSDPEVKRLGRGRSLQKLIILGRIYNIHRLLVINQKGFPRRPRGEEKKKKKVWRL